MAKQFWVNNYFIDVPRNQIKHQQQSTPLPPKALKVLEVLASRAGEVVSHDELNGLGLGKQCCWPKHLTASHSATEKSLWG